MNVASERKPRRADGRGDRLSRMMVGAGCALIIGAPLFAVASACAAEAHAGPRGLAARYGAGLPAREPGAAPDARSSARPAVRTEGGSRP